MKTSSVFLSFLTGLLCVISVAPAAADTILVEADRSGDALTIQAGIDQANTGDTVILGSGTFTGPGNYDIDFLGKAITVRSESSAAETIIDCGKNGRGFIFQTGEGLTSVLMEVTIQNGDTGVFGAGGAILCENASPSIVGNIIQNNEAGGGGGGIACNSGSPEITGNTIIGNRASGQEGGGIWLWSSDASVSGNEIASNEASYGAGIYTTLNSSPEISGNEIHGNSAFASGGGILLDRGSATVVENVIYGNDANFGGGISTQGVDASTLIVRNTLSENHAHSGTGGNIYVSGSPTIEQTIMAYASSGEGLNCIAPSEPLVTCCLIYGNAGGDALCGVDGGDNQFVDPEFCGTIGSNYFYLQSDSPCAAGNSPCSMQIGALEIGCDMTDSEKVSWGKAKTLYR